ncbi:MAG: hypothetical protein Q7S40_17920 [Opitutaceae bacterium]|nr:hypothetical protein [Opitutaceae bacterium]
MKNVPRILLVASVLLNVGLFVLLVAGVVREPIAPVAVVPAARPARAPKPPAYDANTWSTLQTADLPALVTRLRDAGFPPALVRAIVQAQLEEDYFARRKAIDPNAELGPFWKNPTLDPKLEMALREISREQAKRMRELLGPDADFNDPLTRMRQDRQISFLPPERADQVRQIMREFEALRRDVYMSTASTTYGQAEREKVAAIEKRQNEEIARLLGPKDFEEFELRASHTANNLRSRLMAFDATEDEYRMMFRIMRPFDDIFGPMYAPPNSEESRRRREAQKQIDDQIKMALGPVRAAEFVRASNFEYSRTSQLVARLELPPQTTAQLWDVQQEYTKRAQAVYGQPGLSPDDRNRQLTALVTEATGKLKPLLGGDRGLEAYRQNTYWLHGLVPRPPPAGPR